MIDIVSTTTGEDIGLYDTQVQRAANILATQLGSLEYAQDLGIDLVFFLQSDFKFQNESFSAYCIEALANFGINVKDILTTVDQLSQTLDFTLKAEETSTALIAR